MAIPKEGYFEPSEGQVTVIHFPRKLCLHGFRYREGFKRPRKRPFLRTASKRKKRSPGESDVWSRCGCY